jgi:sigma-B regulation protein RsbU (phosphoserine phosphatase)
MLTGVVKSAFYASHVDDFDPLAVVHRVSAGVSAFSANRFVTLFAGRLCPHEHRMEYVNAGHPPPVVWGTRNPLWLRSTGPLVSPALTNARWDAAEVSVDEGDQVLLYTDGVWELLADDEGHAEARLLEIVDRTSEGGGKLLDTILAEVQAELAGRPQPDDVTMMTARVLGGGRAG